MCSGTSILRWSAHLFIPLSFRWLLLEFPVPTWSRLASAFPNDEQLDVAQALLPFHFAAYVTIPDRWSLWRYVALGTAFIQLAAHEWGRSLLLEYPRFFTWGFFTKAGERRYVGT